MILEKLLPQRLAEWRFENDRRTLAVASADSGWTVELTADCADAVGSRLWEVALRPLTPHVDIDLKVRAERVVSRVTGLLEPLKLIEVDGLRRQAQVRSMAPALQGGLQHYYELLLQDDGGASVRRYQAPSSDSPRREQETFALTHEALIKLVGDLASV